MEHTYSKTLIIAYLTFKSSIQSIPYFICRQPCIWQNKPGGSGQGTEAQQKIGNLWEAMRVKNETPSTFPSLLPEPWLAGLHLIHVMSTKRFQRKKKWENMHKESAIRMASDFSTALVTNLKFRGKRIPKLDFCTETRLYIRVKAE